MTILRDQIVRAMRPHTCDLCLTPIATGQRHHAQAIVQDEYVYTWREHEVCREWLGRLGVGDGDVIDQGALADEPVFARWMQALKVLGWRLEDWRLGRPGPTVDVAEVRGVRARFVERRDRRVLDQVTGDELSVERVDGRHGRWDLLVGGVRLHLYDGGYGVLRPLK